MRVKSNRRGAALIVSLFTLMVVVLMAGAVLQSLLNARRQSHRTEIALQAEWLAEAGISRALARLADQSSYSGETWSVKLNESGAAQSTGLIEIRVENDAGDSNRKRILTIARYPHDSQYQLTSRREYVTPEP